MQSVPDFDSAERWVVKGTETWLVNTGSVAGLGAPAPTWVLGNLAAMRFEVGKLTA
jgi:hypothetical protein